MKMRGYGMSSASGTLLKMMMFLVVMALLVSGGSKIVESAQFDKEEVQTAVIEEKYVGSGQRSEILPLGKVVSVTRRDYTYYGIIVNEQTFKLDEKEWNTLKEGQEITYKTLNSGKFKLIGINK